MKKFIVIFTLLLTLIMSVFGIGVFAATSSEVSSSSEQKTVVDDKRDYIKITASNFESENNMSGIVFSQINYVFEKGDVIEYEVFIETDSKDNLKIGALDVRFLDPYSANFGKDTKESYFLSDDIRVYDQNNIRLGVANDISSYANGKWYKRKITVPDAFAGMKAVAWQINQNCDADKTVSARIANVVVTNGEEEKLAVFKKAEDFYDYGTLFINEMYAYAYADAFYSNDSEYIADQSGTVSEYVSGNSDIEYISADVGVVGSVNIDGDDVVKANKFTVVLTVVAIVFAVIAVIYIIVIRDK